MIPEITQYALAILWLAVGLSRDLFDNDQSTIWQKIKSKLQFCLKCQVFWIALLTTLNLPLAALLSVIAAILDKYLS